MTPYKADVGSVWVYEVDRAREFNLDANMDNESVFVVLEGIVKGTSDLDRHISYRHAVNLMTGVTSDFSQDSRLNNYSRRLF